MLIITNFKAVVLCKENDSLYFLNSQIRLKLKQYPLLFCGIYVKPAWNVGKIKEINVNGDNEFPAASLIKIPLAVILLKKIDEGKVSWDKELVLKAHHYASGAGMLRTKKPGFKIKLKKVFSLMLTISDNTATNMIIDFLGGVYKVNDEIKRLGLKKTKVVNFLGDFKGTNKTSPRDLACLLEGALEGNILSKGSRRLLKNTLLQVNNKALIKKGLGKYTRFAHKTGTIGICVGDAGIIYLPFGKKIMISIIVQRPFNSLQGQMFIREVSRLIYKTLTRG